MIKGTGYRILDLQSYIVLGLFCLILANKVVFTHSHHLANGQIVIHAHPFQKSDDSEPLRKHTHNSHEFLIYDNVENYYFETNLDFNSNLNENSAEYLSIYTCMLPNLQLKVKRNKAPPTG